MRIIFTIVFLLTLGFLQGQTLLKIEPPIIKKQITIELIDASYEEILKVSVTNTANRALELRSDKEVAYQPYSWESQICDKESSYPSNVKSNYDPIQGVMAPVRLSPGESFDLYLTILPYHKTGQCKIEIPFREVSRPEEIIGTATFQVNIISNADQTSQTSNKSQIKIFPNPVHERFFLSGTPELSRVDVYNTLGRKIKSFDAPQAGDSFDAGDLPQGVYLLSIVDTKGKVIRTLRLLRRDFRP